MTAPKIIRERVNDAYGNDHRLALIAVRELADVDVPWLERRAVLIARRDGASWGEIGRLLGRSRQATRKRYGSIDGTPPPIVPLPTGRVDRYVAIWRNDEADRRQRREFDALDDGDVVPW